MISECKLPRTADDVPKTPPGVALSQLLTGSLVTQLIHVAAILGIADILSAGPKSSQDLAVAVNVNLGALYRVLRVLASLGIFTETDPGTFSMTPLAEPWRNDAPGSLRGSAILCSEIPDVRIVSCIDSGLPQDIWTCSVVMRWVFGDPIPPGSISGGHFFARMAARRPSGASALAVN